MGMPVDIAIEIENIILEPLDICKGLMIVEHLRDLQCGYTQHPRESYNWEKTLKHEWKYNTAQ
jgi:hypothetical protein